MTWTHPSVKQNKSTASSACSFYYLFLASRRVYKTAPYCISWSYPLPPFISVWRFSFRRHDAAPLFAKPRQSPLLNMQPASKVRFPSLPISLSLPLSFSLTCFSLSFLSHRLFTQSSRATSALRGNTGPAKEFIEFVVQLIPWRQAGVESGMRGMEGWRYGRGQENREGGLMWRAGNCIRGVWLKITRQSLNWNRSCSNLLPPPYLSPNAVKWAKWETETIEAAIFFSLFLYLFHWGRKIKSFTKTEDAIQELITKNQIIKYAFAAFL